MKKTLLASLFLLQGCTLAAQTESLGNQTLSGTHSRSQVMRQALHENQWLLISYFNQQEMQPASLDHPATLLFSARRVSGNASCNQYFASYQLAGENTLNFSQSGSTMMACQGESGIQEQHYLKNLSDIQSYKVQGNQLHLLDSNKQERLVFKAMPKLTLQSNAWQATGINNGRGGVVNNATTQQAFLEFTADSIQGSSGCNSLRANYQVEGKQLDVGPILSTKKLCPPELMAQEQQMTQALGEVTHYEIRPNQLRLLNAQGALMMSLKPR
ncbi:MAG: META domain-containing protein [Methyloprofundus sp.]|nr:META domain-containing protein [Methyloprofundus sp.]